MNEETAKLIRELAEKLGTTAEHLWGVLVRQAPISGTIGILCDAAILWLIYFAWKKLAKVNFTDNWGEESVNKGLCYAGLFIASAIAIVCALGALPLEISGILNPEYWALRQVMK